ncbi:MAG: CHASE2 domain-containing protein, partial [Cyanobacteriota bacterium]
SFYIKMRNSCYKEQSPIEFLEKHYFTVDDRTGNISAIQNYLQYYSMGTYLQGIYKYSENIGISKITLTDSDKVVRGLQLLYKFYDNYIFSLPLAVAYKVSGSNEPIILDKYSLRFDNKNIPLRKDLTYLINWRSKAKITEDDLKNGINVPGGYVYKSISFINVFWAAFFSDPDNKVKMDKNPINPDIFKDKIVLIAKVELTNKDDIHSVPYSGRISGVEILAASIDNLLNDKSFLKQVSPLVNSLV